MTKMQKALEGICLDSPARIGATIFGKGIPVSTVIEAAQRLYNYHETFKDADTGHIEKPRRAADPWIAIMYDITNEYHKRTGKKVQIADLLSSFFAESLQAIEQDDRALFEKRLRERLA